MRRRSGRAPVPVNGITAEFTRSARSVLGCDGSFVDVLGAATQLASREESRTVRKAMFRMGTHGSERRRDRPMVDLYNTILSMGRISLLGIPIDSLTKEEALTKLRSMLGGSAEHHVMTPNNEMLVESTKNAAFQSVLKGSDLNLPDSTGLLFAARLTGQSLYERVPGVDTVQELLKNLGPEHPVFFLGAAEGIADRAAAVMQKQNPRLKVAGCYSGSPRDSGLVERINAAKPHLLLVAFGAPKQDLWIAHHLKQMPSVRVAMGVGGTFDFLAGKIRRAPGVLRALGLEWLWRLFQEPRRIGRILRAVIVFPLLVLRYGKNAP